MLTLLSTVKSRLALAATDATYDALLERAIVGVSARFDAETNRVLARTQNARFEFAADETEILVPCYPVESVLKFELKTNEPGGWVEVPDVEYIVRRRCIVSLRLPLAVLSSALPPQARVTYTGGYVLPGEVLPGAESERLPAEIEQAAVEQTAFWFLTRDQPGLIRQWPKGGNYEQFADPDLLPSVREVLKHYERQG